MINKLLNRFSKEYLLGLSGLVVLAIVALLVAQRDWTPSFDTDVSATDSDFIEAGPFQIAVSVQPETPQVGNNHIVIQVKDSDGEPVTDAQVRAVGEMPAMGAMPAMYAQADIAETEPGTYRGDFELSMEGSWPLAVDVATDEAHHVDLAFDMATGRRGITLTTATPVGDVAYHTCSMHPSVQSATPGTCPICSMDLVPVTHEELQSGSVLVDEGRRQTIGIKTGEVVRAPFSVPVRLQGEVTYDETRLTDISLRFNGWIGELNADFEGKPIRQGDTLFTVYSPDLLSLQEQHLETLKRNQQNSPMLTASRKRLRLWGLNHEQITWLEQQGEVQDYVPIFAPADGVVLDKHIVSGSSFKQGQQLLRLADLSSLWIETFAYEQDMSLIGPGMPASVRLTNVPGDAFEASVMQVDPFLRDNTRTARVRLQVDNPDGALKPGLFATVTLQADFGEMLVIPEEAVLVTGEKRIVFLDMGEGRLKPVTIRTGYSDGERIVVRRGLQEGDKIVTSGNFLIAAESKLKAGLDQW